MSRPLQPREIRLVYECEWCAYFALALNDLTGQPLLEVGNLDLDGDLRGGHFVLDVGDGWVADASGLHPLGELLARWKSTTTRYVSVEALMHELAYDPDDDEAPDMTENLLLEIRKAKAAIVADRGFLQEVPILPMVGIWRPWR